VHRTMLKSKIHRATVTDRDSYAGHDPDELDNYEPRVVQQIINVDREVATLLG